MKKNLGETSVLAQETKKTIKKKTDKNLRNRFISTRPPY